MLNPGSRTLALCADDFGAGLELSRVVVDLAARGRLTAVSCLTSSPHWPACAPMLRDLPTGVQRGLHFGLTAFAPLSAELRLLWPRAPRLPTLLWRAALRALPLPALAAEWRRQWDAFVAATGHLPDFVDGHQHVHHLPGVRDVVLSGLPDKVAVRNTGCLPGPGHAFKRTVIAESGGRGLLRELCRRHVAHNAALLGVYDFQDPDYRGLMKGWMRAVPANGALLFCHPGTGDDAIGPARRREAQYLGSEAFVQDLAEAGISLGSVWRQSSSDG